MKRRLLKNAPAAALGLGAGIAAAVLFSLAGRAALFSAAFASFAMAALANLSPLPIMIAMLGFGLVAGATAVGAGAITVAGLFYAQQSFGHVDSAALAGLAFALFIGLPALWLSLLAVLSRVKGSPTWAITTRVGSFFAREYCPLERILSYAASICATIGVAIAIYVADLYGGFNTAVEKLSTELAQVIPSIQLPEGIDAKYLAKIMVMSAAPTAAGGTLIMLMLNLWLAGRVVQLSNQLPRPWPDVARELRLPQVFLLLFGAAAVAGPYLGGLPGLIMIIVAATLGVAFALDGLAVAHYLTRGKGFRVPLLTLIYAGLAISVIVPPIWPVFVLPLVLLGVIETAFSLRERKDKPLPPKASPTES